MTLSATADLVAAATADGTAVLAFNVVTLEACRGHRRRGRTRRGRRAHAGERERRPVPRRSPRAAGLGLRTHACRAVRGTRGNPPRPLQDVALLTEAIDTPADLDVTSIMVDAAQPTCHSGQHRPDAGIRATRASRRPVGRSEIGRDRRQTHRARAGARTDPDEAAAFTERQGSTGLPWP